MSIRASASAPGSAQAAAARSAGRPSGSERILVADSDREWRRLIAQALAPVGLPIVEAATFPEAMAHLRQEGLALVLAADRPGFDGVALMAIRDDSLLAVRILLTDDRTYPTPPHPGTHRFVVDPFEPRNLEAMAREALRGHRLAVAARDHSRDRGDEIGRLQNRQRLLDAVVVERSREVEAAYQKLQAQSRQAIQALAEAIEARDPYTKGHCARVAHYAVALARETRYPESEIETLEFAAFLHDVGKIGIRDAVLLKPAPLDDEEWRHMKTHPIVGYEIAVQLDMLRPLVACIRNHHERWDGSGYPDGLRGENIPAIARVVAIADAFDAMSTDRPYKPALSLDECCAAFDKQRGRMYDPQLSDLFVERVIGEIRVA